MHRSNRRAFTLAEVMVVVSLIAILVALLLPALSKARDQAYAVRSLSNLRQLSLATVNYASNNFGWLAGWKAITRNPSNDDPPAYMKRSYHWATKYGLLAEGEYLSNFEFWIDPHDGGIRQFLATPRAYTKLEPVPDVDTHGDRKYFTYSYTMAGHMQKPVPGDASSLTSWHGGSVPDRISNFRDPSLDMVYGEENTGHEEGTLEAMELGLSYGPTVINDGGFNNDYTEPRHFGESQACFLDGSARHIPAGIKPMAKPKRGEYNEWNRNFRYDPVP